MIIFAIENNGYVYAYDENKETIITEPGKLYNYNEKTVAIKRGSNYYVYNANGELVFSYPNDINIDNIVGVYL